MAERLLTLEEVAERLVVAPKTIRDWLREGKLRGLKVGKLWRVREQDLEAFLAEAERATTQGKDN
ncbi:MAG: helix-turn-helix domain-containing protein [Firmicutes bacterium]|nr:helix-turn-helix domain-containing protein [Bacillota bacterium]